MKKSRAIKKADTASAGQTLSNINRLIYGLLFKIPGITERYYRVKVMCDGIRDASSRPVARLEPFQPARSKAQFAFGIMVSNPFLC